MSSFYEAVGRLVVSSVRKRYGAQLAAIAAVGIAAVVLGAVGAYLAGRADEEDED